jgi:hypothetical protein
LKNGWLGPSLVREVYWKIVWLCVTSSQGTSLRSPLNPNFWQEHPSSMNVYQNFHVLLDCNDDDYGTCMNRIVLSVAATI